MKKINELASSAVVGTKKSVTYVKENWHEPKKEGNQISVKGFLGINLAAIGIEGASGVFDYLAFSSTSAVLGLIFGLSLQSTYIISSLGTVLSLLFVPIIALITDNIGMVGKKTENKIHIGAVLTTIVCAALWVTPSTSFDFILTDLFKHIAIIVFFKYMSIYVYLIMYKLFGQKHGKYKPWVLFMGLPAVILSVVMVNIPYQELRPSTLLLAVSAASTAMTVFSEPYKSSYKKMRNLMTQNNQERTFLFSIIPVISGLLNSATTTLMPIVATLLGYEVNSIGIYKIIIPIFGVFSIATSLFIIWSEEKIKSAPTTAAERLGFKETITTLCKNKYIWITKIATTFAAVSDYDLILFNWMLLYSLREQAWIGILLTLGSIPATPANLLTPLLSKKFDNRKLILTMKLIQIAIVVAHIPFIFSGNKVMVMVLMTLLSMASTMVRKPRAVLETTYAAQALDYHEWKFGKRVDESINYIAYFTVPFTLLLGYCSPYFMSLVGFVSDRDVLYDSTVSSSVFVVIVVLYILELLGNTIPYFFFDLDDATLATMKKDLEQRRIDSKKEKEAQKEQEKVDSIA
ncbi:MAG: MFS transporter [Clostridia bacterium]